MRPSQWLALLTSGSAPAPCQGFCGCGNDSQGPSLVVSLMVEAGAMGRTAVRDVDFLSGNQPRFHHEPVFFVGYAVRNCQVISVVRTELPAQLWLRSARPIPTAVARQGQHPTFQMTQQEAEDLAGGPPQELHWGQSFTVTWAEGCEPPTGPEATAQRRSIEG